MATGSFTDAEHAPDLYRARSAALNLVNSVYAFIGFVGDVVEQVSGDETGDLECTEGFVRIVEQCCADIDVEPKTVVDGTLTMLNFFLRQLQGAHEEHWEAFEPVALELRSTEREALPSVNGFLGASHLDAIDAAAGHVIAVSIDGFRRYTVAAEWDESTPDELQQFCSSNWHQTCVDVIKSLPEEAPDEHSADHPSNVRDLIREEFRVAFNNRCVAHVPAEEVETRPAFERDHRWLNWNQKDKLGPAAIRDKWNVMTDEDRQSISPRKPERIQSGEQGRDTVKKAIELAKKEPGKT